MKGASGGHLPVDCNGHWNHRGYREVTRSDVPEVVEVRGRCRRTRSRMPLSDPDRACVQPQPKEWKEALADCAAP